MIKRRAKFVFLRLIFGSSMIWIALLLALMTAIVLVPRYFSAFTTLKVAVATGGADEQLISTINEFLPTTTSRLQFSLVGVADADAAARAMETGKADLAVVRGDVRLPANGATILTLHHDAALFVARSASFKDIGDLAKKGKRARKRIGILPETPENHQLLLAILRESAVSDADLEILPVKSAEINAEMWNRLDVVMSVGPLGSRDNDILVTTAAAGTTSGAAILDGPGADGIALHRPIFHAVSIPQGYFGAAVTIPDDGLSVLGVDYLLQARANLDETTVSTLTRRLFVIRPQVAAKMPLASSMERPEDEKTSAHPLHVGAAAYYSDNEKSFLDRYSDMIYLGAMLLGILGSPIALLRGLRNAGTRHAAQKVIDDLIAARERACDAKAFADLAELDPHVDRLLSAALRHARHGDYDEDAMAVLRLAMDEARAAMVDLRGRMVPPDRSNVTLLRGQEGVSSVQAAPEKG